MATFSYSEKLDDGLPADPHTGSPSLLGGLVSAGDADAQTSVVGSVVYVHTSLTEAQSDAAYAAWDPTGTNLTKAISAKTAAIDVRTEELLEEFTYGGDRYGMSGEQRIELLAIMGMANTVVATAGTWTSFDWPSRDGTVLTISSTTIALDFTSTAFNHAVATKLAGNAHKAAVEALTTVADVEAYVDPR